MLRQLRLSGTYLLCGITLFTGCQPTQPFFFREDGDLSHYLGVATTIDYPDVSQEPLSEVTGAQAPLTLENADEFTMWDLSLEEVTRITMCNSQVMRQLGARVQSTAPETLSRTIVSPVTVTTTYDPALIESSTGSATGSVFGGTGTEAALAAFDATLDASIFWEKNDQPQNRPSQNNVFGGLFPPVFQQDLGNFTTGITKTTATGTTYAFRNNTIYDANNGGLRPLTSDWNTSFEATFSHPLFQGSGTQYNRIAGPMSFEQYAAGGVNPIDGVVIARIRTDQSLADFEGGIRNLMRDVESAYWDLYFAYRDLDAKKLGRDSALETWKRTAALYRTGSRGGGADREAQAKSQYFLFRSQVEQALSALYSAENNLRYIMGISMSDGRLIRPADEPSTARISFDWAQIHTEALVRRVELRKQKWEIKRRELELVAAKNHLLPRLDAVGRYRWRGLGDDLIDASGSTASFNEPGSNAFDILTGGNFQEWQLGLQLNVPIGFRVPLSTMRHHQLLLARERALLQDLEIEISHQLGEAIRDIDLQYSLAQSNFNRRVAAEKAVQALAAQYENDRVTLDTLLESQRLRADAEAAYYRSLVDYNRAIMNAHYRKGSLLEYNGVFLEEGGWPGKAYFDAMRRARQRDASMYLDYGFNSPGPISRGEHPQQGFRGDYGPNTSYLPPIQPPTRAVDDATPEPLPEGLPEELTPPEEHSSWHRPLSSPADALLQPRSLTPTAGNRSVTPARFVPPTSSASDRPVAQAQFISPAPRATPLGIRPIESDTARPASRQHYPQTLTGAGEVTPLPLAP